MFVIINYLLLTGITVTDGSLLEQGVQDQQVIVGGGRLQGLDILGGFVELLKGKCNSIDYKMLGIMCLTTMHSPPSGTF